jgi:hypothetical protein
MPSLGILLDSTGLTSGRCDKVMCGTTLSQRAALQEQQPADAFVGIDPAVAPKGLENLPFRGPAFSPDANPKTAPVKAARA